MWVAKIMDHFCTCTYSYTEVIQLPCSGQQAFFINVEIWLVTLTDESEASNRKHVSLSFVVVKE